MKTKEIVKLTKREVKKMNSTQLRELASALKVKNYSRFQKADLLPIVCDQLVDFKKEAKRGPKKPSKSSILRTQIEEMQQEGLSIDSGSLISVMKEKFNIVMHRSFVITVRNKMLKQQEA